MTDFMPGPRTISALSSINDSKLADITVMLLQYARKIHNSGESGTCHTLVRCIWFKRTVWNTWLARTRLLGISMRICPFRDTAWIRLMATVTLNYSTLLRYDNFNWFIYEFRGQHLVLLCFWTILPISSFIIVFLMDILTKWNIMKFDIEFRPFSCMSITVKPCTVTWFPTTNSTFHVGIRIFMKFSTIRTLETIIFEPNPKILLSKYIQDWNREYLHENYSELLGKTRKDFLEPCPDVFWFPVFNQKFCRHLVDIMENFGRWSSGTNKVHHICVHWITVGNETWFRTNGYPEVTKTCPPGISTWTRWVWNATGCTCWTSISDRSRRNCLKATITSYFDFSCGLL